MTEDQKNILIRAVKEAGQILISEEKTEIFSKVNNFDYGIPADKKSEEILIKAVKKSSLNCQIIAEESGQTGNENAEYKVFIDPLDGSVNYSRNIPAFSIGVAIFSKKNEPLLGIIYEPTNDELFIAEKGKGIKINGKSILPKFRSDKVLLNLEWFGAPEYPEIVKKLYEVGLRARTAGTGVLAFCYGCIGRGDGTILIKNRPWDVAPGLVFAQEAGLITKTFNGTEVDLTQDNINLISAPKELFNKIKEILS